MASFLLSESALERNARILHEVAAASGARMLVALKACSTTSCFDILRPYAAGCCASGLYEARLAARHMGGHVAVYSPAYRDEELEELLKEPAGEIVARVLGVFFGSKLGRLDVEFAL